MSFEIAVRSEFSSAHRLVGYKGKCEELHGHNWKTEAIFLRKDLDKKGMVLDFKVAKKRLNRVLKKLDHKCLNDLDFFKKNNPTSENICYFIYSNLKSKDKNLKLLKVTVWETDRCSASYSEE